MGWTWAEYEATPISVVERLIETLRREAEEREDRDIGPRARRQLT